MKKLFIIIFIFLYQASFGQMRTLKISPNADTLTSFTNGIDSIKNKLPSDTLTSHINRLDSIQNNFTTQVDSIQQSYTKSVTKIQSLTAKYQHSADSFSTLNLPAGKYTQKIDSLKGSLAAVQEKVTEKLNSIKQKTTNKIKDLPLTPELNDKVSQLTSKMEGVNLSALETNMPGNLDLDKLSNSIPHGGLPSLDLPQVDGPKDLVAIPGMKDINNLTPDLGQVSNVTEQAGSLQGKIEDASGNLSDINQVDKLAESQASQLDEMKVLQEQQGNSSLNGLGSEQQAKDQLKEQVKTLATNHFAGKEKQLQHAMETISKYKAKYESVSAIGDLPKKRPNEMKGKPFLDRLVPGIGMQIQKKGDDLMVDFNPYAGYRFTGRITGGLGWNERVAYNTRHYHFNSSARIYGPRAFGEFKLWKGFSPRAELEVMHTNVPPLIRTSTLDLGNPQWVWGAFAGMKKEYRFIKRVKGTASIMMRLFDPHHKSPYADVINARIGFEFPLKKKVKAIQI